MTGAPRRATPPAALVTGGSSGIGRAVALRLHRAGIPVYATARRLDRVADLAAAGMRTVELDVTDDNSARAAVDRVVGDHGSVGLLVNNAGFGLPGTIEETDIDRVRQQFETNFFGMVRMTQLVLPGMRAARAGTVVNMSSIFGGFATPGGGFYAASKHAVEAQSDALRLEVAQFRIRVVVVQPGPVRTPWGERYVAGFPAGDDGPYGDFGRRAGAYYAAIYSGDGRGLAARFTVSADDVARVVERVLRRRRPRSHYPVGMLARSVLGMRHLLPRPAFDAFVRRQFPRPDPRVRRPGVTRAE
ncbi:SDR family NAD(P)-dependent oxidoreductase [Micromonospora tarensis]|uniref:SDR family NAD(P)-dependent oxidoreductase n=1 Tax=Micromonospora tarensis TaxID=2806100 RepID=A0ABS1YEQ9_9ACTN|nr:SDR family NAD(P)-dependent oxidoreductase [Micromonospora tarensis]MBM0275900.1 SDR family NAD(P)-dependent oxidoreductase [Micromonospora tarensis]